MENCVAPGFDKMWYIIRSYIVFRQSNGPCGDSYFDPIIYEGTWYTSNIIVGILLPAGVGISKGSSSLSRTNQKYDTLGRYPLRPQVNTRPRPSKQ